jgi:hypothetical protein
MFNFIGKLFKSKEKEQTISSQDIQIEQANPIIEKKELRDIQQPCKVCNKIIGAERYTKKSGVYFHKHCFTTTKRLALNGKL